VTATAPSSGGRPRLPGTTAASDDPVLEISGLRTWFFTADGVVKAVDGVDLSVRRGEVLGLVGESGSGKSVSMFSALRLVSAPGRIVAGDVRVKGRDVLAMSTKELRQIRGDEVTMIFQQPNSSLNPCFRVGEQISEVYEIHEHTKRKAGLARAVEMLRAVGIPDPERRSRSYPHQLSGGMAQRVMIAMALAGDPDLLIADEPTTALDVTIQAQILDLMRRLQADVGTAMVLITHDLGVVAENAERVAVMYAGQVVEETDTGSLFRAPLHPYTQGLIGSVPVIGRRQEELAVIPGRVPNLIDLPPGCRFAPRCQARVDANLAACTEALPALVEVAPGHKVRCFLHSDAVEADVPVELTPGKRRGR
jgi:oligopeptide/dipeptide ABC transporter ATP-binding protein